MMDAGQFKALFGEHKDRVYNFALKMLADKDEAEDVTQEIFLKLYHRSGAEPIADIKSWLFISARNLCLNKLRVRRREVAIEYAVDIESPDSSTHQQQNRLLENAMQLLEPDQRESLILKEYEKLSYREIAGIMGISVPAVRSLLYRARCDLRRRYLALQAKGTFHDM
jgi:RNA polymerase sigma-70 factor, ECF subfamily